MEGWARRTGEAKRIRLWLIPMIYVGASVVGGLFLPRLEHAYFGSYTLSLSVTSAQAYLSAVASGMMALTGIVFSIAFVMVQFSAIAYSPRLVLWFARDRTLFHSLGIFVATFIYALGTLAWIDRGGAGTVPLFSCVLVAALLTLSVLLFSRLVQRLSDLQITNVLHMIGDKGRQVIREMSQFTDEQRALVARKGTRPIDKTHLGPISQSLKYSGDPRSVVKFDIGSLIRQARQADAVIVMACAVGDTLVEDALLLCVHGGREQILRNSLQQAVHLDTERTFEQDPKYPIRLLVDIAIKALSPAINDPTTAVQAIDQIEDLLRRLGRCGSGADYALDDSGDVRIIFPTPTWEDYLALAFDEIRQFGGGSIQVIRRLRSALLGLTESVVGVDRVETVRKYLLHLDLAIEHSPFDADDRAMAHLEDRQGLGLSRGRVEPLGPAGVGVLRVAGTVIAERAVDPAGIGR
ncbi:MAG: DUF2254 domain-containing protein [Xanthobacteraceae bacterium]